MSAPGSQVLAPVDVIAGSLYRYVVRHVDDNGDPIDVSDRTFLSQVRKNGTPEATAALAQFTADTTDAATGVIAMTLTAAQTRLLQGQVHEALIEYQYILDGDTDPTTAWLREASIIGDAAR